MDTKQAIAAATLCAAGLAVQACDGLLAGDSCEKVHAPIREVVVSGVTDTMRVGDRISFRVEMPWLAPTEEGEVVDLTKLDTLRYPVAMFGVQVPVGEAPDRDNSGFRNGQEPAFDASDLTPGGKGEVFMDGGGRAAILKGDRSAASWCVEFSLRLRRPGRNLITFIPIDEPGNPYATDKGGLRVEGLTEEGCTEDVQIQQHLLGYVNNEAMVTALEEGSRIKLRRNMSGIADSQAGIYVFVEP